MMGPAGSKGAQVQGGCRSDSHPDLLSAGHAEDMDHGAGGSESCSETGGFTRKIRYERAQNRSPRASFICC